MGAQPSIGERGGEAPPKEILSYAPVLNHWAQGEGMDGGTEEHCE